MKKIQAKFEFSKDFLTGTGKVEPVTIGLFVDYQNNRIQVTDLVDDPTVVISIDSATSDNITKLLHMLRLTEDAILAAEKELGFKAFDVKTTFKESDLSELDFEDTQGEIRETVSYAKISY